MPACRNGQDHEGDPDDHRVDAEVLGQAAGHAAQHAVLVGPAEEDALLGAVWVFRSDSVAVSSGFTVFVFMPLGCVAGPGPRIGEIPGAIPDPRDSGSDQE